MTIVNGKDRRIGTASLPNVAGALSGLLQPLVFTIITKEVVDGEVRETRTDVAGRGVIQPFTERQLLIKPEGQRAWTWLMCHAEAGLPLKVDDVVTYVDVDTRVMAIKDFGVYGYLEYHLVQDWTEAPP